MASLTLKGSTSGQIALTVPAIAGTRIATFQPVTGDVLVSPVAMNLPAGLGVAGYVLTTDGAGNLSWTASSGGGSVTSVSTTLAGITINNPSTTPSIGGTLAASSGGTGITSLGTGVAAALGFATNNPFGLATLNVSGVLPTSLGGTGINALGTGVQTALGLNANAANAFPTLNASGVLSTARGGTGLSALGSAGQVLTVNGGGTALIWATPSSAGFNVTTVTTNYTLALTDATSSVQYDNTTAATITVPTNAAVAFPVGTEVEVGQIGTGPLTIGASGGVTLNAANGVYFNRQNQFARLRKTATNTWSLAYYGYGARADIPAYPQVSATGAIIVDRDNGEVQRLSVTGNVTSTSIVNVGTAGVLCKLVLEIWNTGAFTLTWPVGTIWPGGFVPTITSGAGAKDVYILMTMDGGTTFYGTVVGQNYA